MGITNIVHVSVDNLNVMMDPFLADILINNLLSNAIKYGSKNADISVFTEKQFLKVSNWGQNALIYPEKLHLRFYREDTNNKSTGLGLSLVKKITDLYKFKMSYRFEEQHHVFTIDFTIHP